MMETKSINSEENRKKEKEFNDVNLFKKTEICKIEQEFNFEKGIVGIK